MANINPINSPRPGGGDKISDNKGPGKADKSQVEDFDKLMEEKPKALPGKEKKINKEALEKGKKENVDPDKSDNINESKKDLKPKEEKPKEESEGSIPSQAAAQAGVAQEIHASEKVEAKTPVSQVDVKAISDIAKRLGAEIKVQKPSEPGKPNVVKISLGNIDDRRLKGTTFEIVKNGKDVTITCNPSTPEGRSLIEGSLQNHLQVQMKDNDVNITVTIKSQQSGADAEHREGRSRGEYVPEEDQE